MKYPKRPTAKVTDPDQQAMAAFELIDLGHPHRPDILAGALCLTGKRARKLMKAARRVVAEFNGPNAPTRAARIENTPTEPVQTLTL